MCKLKRTLRSRYNFFTRVELSNSSGDLCSDFPVGDLINVCIQFESTIALNGTVVGFGITSATELPIITTWSLPENFVQGTNSIVFKFENIYLAPGTYKIVVGLSRGNEVLDFNTDTAFFNVSDVLNMPDSNRLININSGILMNQLSYKII